MYEEFFGFREKPFSILPDPDLIYWGFHHRLAFSLLEFGVLNSAGFTVITGEIGSGKTTLIRYLLKRLDPHFNVALISNTPNGRDELLQWIMMALGLPFERSYPALFMSFSGYVREQFNKGRRTILIIDEAQNLGIDSLEQLRMLSNVNADKDQMLQTILVGQPQLNQLLRTPQLVQFAQRISSDFHLKPLGVEDVANYISYRLQAVGSQTQVFTSQACNLVAQASHGVPRVINILCDTALVYGFAANMKTISAELVQMVISDKREYGVLPLTTGQPFAGPVLVERKEK
jgi:type II secretory pathway predicted ATPase ExeA